MDGDSIRSLLFVPGDSQSKALKALASEADALILDLEDAVAPAAKSAARATTRAILENEDRRGKLVFVRINAFSTGLANADLASTVRGNPWGIVLPKCNDFRELEQLSNHLDILENREGIPEGSIKLLAVATETARGTLNLSLECGTPLPRLWGLMWGSEDLSAALGAFANRDATGAYTFPYQFARSQCLFSSSALGIAAVDAVFTNFRDLAGLEGETADALRDGFSAKAAIHPAQVAVINRVLTPDSKQVEWAGQVASLLRDTGVAQLDGRMIDLAHKRIADRILKRAAARPARA
jgi:citrate lyase subunit beta / citryl-CoA lyase